MLRPGPALPRELLVEPLDLDDDTVLTGPGRGPEDIDIDPIFAVDWRTALEDLRADAQVPKDDFAYWLRGFADLPVLLERPGLRIVAPADLDGFELGAAAIDAAGDLVGLFTGPTLRVRDDRQGDGIGGALVAARLLGESWLPVWEHDRCGWTPAGAAAARSGLRLARDIKRAEIEAETSPAP